MSKFEDNLWAELEREHALALLQNVATQRRQAHGAMDRRSSSVSPCSARQR